ncbi:hypothetical protein BH11BAC2_BH11BAC2_22380 [soil metagenome]
MKKLFRNFFIPSLLVLIFNPFNFTTAQSVLPLSVSIDTIPDACNSSSGQANAIADGGVLPYTYLWSTSATTQSITGLPAGQYTVTVSDAASATVTTTVDVFNNNYLFTIINFVSPTLGSNCNGGIDFSVLNGVGLNTTQWCDGSILSSRNDLCGISGASGCSFSSVPPFDYSTTQYTVVITDQNGCSATLSQGISSVGFETPTSPSIFGACNSSANGIIIDTLNTFDFLNSPQLPDPWHFVPPVLLKIAYTDSATLTTDTLVITNPSALDYIPYQFNNLLAGTAQIGFYVQNPISLADELFYTQRMVIPDLGMNCGNVSGNIFLDLNKDCNSDVNEPGLANTIINLEPGSIYTTTDSLGNYSIDLNYGNYSIQHTAPLFKTSSNCPSAGAINITINNFNPTTIINFADTTSTITNLVCSSFISLLSSGSSAMLTTSVQNLSATNSYLDTLVVTWDSVLTVNSVYPIPDILSNGSAIWYIDSLAILEKFTSTIYLQVPADPFYVGYFVQAHATLYSGTPDQDLQNNHSDVIREIKASSDPNYKSANPSGFSAANFVPKQNQWMEYTINFQNTGIDTAQTIIVRDTLSENLNLLTYQTINSSFPFNFQIEPGRVLKFTFSGINLPDSNTNALESHGFVSFRVQRKADTYVNTVINNAAAIYFDNSLVITNDAFVTLFDCDSIFNNGIQMTINSCEGSTVQLAVNVTVPTQLNWYLDNQFLQTGTTCTTPPLITGAHQVEVIASTPYCNASYFFQINTASIPVTFITINADTLSSSNNSGVTYQWLLNGNIIVGADSVNYVALQTGNYSVIVTDFNGCSGIAPDVFVTITSLSEAIHQPQVVIQPNPAHDQCTLILPEGFSNKNIKIYFRDAVGKELRNPVSFSAITDNTLQLSLNGIIPGFYLVELQNESGKFTGRLIIN